jgi:hypothetical protein
LGGSFSAIHAIHGHATSAAFDMRRGYDDPEIRSVYICTNFRKKYGRAALRLGDLGEVGAELVSFDNEKIWRRRR